MGEDTNFSLILTLTSIKRECITYVQIIGQDVVVVDELGFYEQMGID